MAPDGQVRLQASGIHLDHSLLSPSSLAYFCRWSNAATVERWIWNLNSERGSGGPTAVCSDQLFDACGGRACAGLA
jgi:hypothetical protein